jgi:hypothetical protein
MRDGRGGKQENESGIHREIRGSFTQSLTVRQWKRQEKLVC